MPRSTAVRRREVISCVSLGGPYEKLIPMQPNPRADTSRLLFPSLRFFIGFSLEMPLGYSEMRDAGCRGFAAVRKSVLAYNPFIQIFRRAACNASTDCPLQACFF